MDYYVTSWLIRLYKLRIKLRNIKSKVSTAATYRSKYESKENFLGIIIIMPCGEGIVTTYNAL